DTLAREVVAFVQRLRSADLTKVPGIAETIDWAAALVALGAKRLEAEQIERTLGALLKYQEDVSAMRGGGASKLLDEVRVGVRGDRKSTRLNSSHVSISYAVCCLKKKTRAS